MAGQATVCEGTLVVERATPGELEPVLSLLAEAGQWLLSKGIRQWPQPPPAAYMLKAIGRGEVHLAKAGRRSVGTFTLSWSDGLWTGRAGDAGYVHRLAVRRAFAGRGLGLHLLRHATRVAARAGKELLRLDCWAGNAVLCDYYERAGFSRCGTAVEGNYSCCLFQKRVAITGS